MLLTAFPDLQHHLFLLTLEGKLGLSPPNEQDSKVKRVLDVGTGTGIWAIEFGDLHPEAEVCQQNLMIFLRSYTKLKTSCRS